MRLAGKAKMGFYPTPVNIVNDIKNMLSISGDVKILDTCCGEGDALRDLKSGRENIKTYGAELDSDRYMVAKDNVDDVLNCDSINELYATNRAFDILFLNPPYDTDVPQDDELTIRLEKKFLQQHLKYLAAGGILIYIIPIYVIKHIAGCLGRLQELQVLAFPLADFSAFRQVVIIGRNSKGATSETIAANRLMLTEITDRRTLPTTETPKWTYSVTPCGQELKSFYTSRINPDDAVELIKKSPLNAKFEMATKVQSMNHIKPLTELTSGHLAMLIAGGMMDGMLKNNNEELVVKGFVSESFDERTEQTDGGHKSIKRKKYDITINALNLTTEKLIRVNA